MTRHDRIRSIDLSLAFLPLATPVSDAKVLTGRQKPLTRVAFLFALVRTVDGAEGLGFSYSKRAGGPGLYAHAREIAPELIGEDPSDTGRLWEKLAWAGASVGRGGLSVQAIAALDVALWDLKARRAGLSLAKLLGAYRDAVPCYNTSGGFLSSPLEEVLDNARESLAAGIGGIKIKVGHPDSAVDTSRVEAVREAIGPAAPLMVDANQQWTRATALRIGRVFEAYDLTWIEEPLDAHDAEGHAALAAALDTPVATGEMLTSVAEHERMISAGAADFIQPDAPRVGGITPFLKVLALAEQRRLSVAPHFAMELHVHLAAAYPHEAWVEHFDWLEPLFNERLAVAGGKMTVPDRPGLGLTLSERAAAWTVDRTAIGPGALGPRRRCSGCDLPVVDPQGQHGQVDQRGAGPGSAGTRGEVGTLVPSWLVTRSPPARSRSALRGSASTVTWCPAPARRAATNPPTAPAPTMRNLNGSACWPGSWRRSVVFRVDMAKAPSRQGALRHRECRPGEYGHSRAGTRLQDSLVNELIVARN